MCRRTIHAPWTIIAFWLGSLLLHGRPCWDGTASLALAADTSAENLLEDASFEASREGAETPERWSNFFSQPAGAYSSRVVAGGRTGKQSLRIAGDGDFGVAAGNLVPLDRKRRYAVRGWVKVEGDADAAADVKFHYYDATGKYLEQTRIGYVMPASKGWQFITVIDHAESVPNATQIGLAVAITRKCRAQFDDLELLAFDRENLPKDFELEYGTMPKLRVLHRRVGTWELDTTIKPCIWNSRGERIKETEKIDWTLGGQFVRSVKSGSNGQETSLDLMTFDPRTDTYRHWFFDNRGVFPRGEFGGSWDEAKQTFKFVGDVDAIKSEFTLRVISSDRMEFEGRWVGKDGKVYLDMSGVCRRKTAEK